MQGIGQTQGLANARAPRPNPMIPGLIDQIINRLCSIEEQQGVVDGAIYRIIAPTSVNAVGENAKAACRPETVEESLSAIIRKLDSILQTEVQHADALNGAV